jgi:hypothetical protein
LLLLLHGQKLVGVLSRDAVLIHEDGAVVAHRGAEYVLIAKGVAPSNLLCTVFLALNGEGVIKGALPWSPTIPSDLAAIAFKLLLGRR